MAPLAPEDVVIAPPGVRGTSRSRPRRWRTWRSPFRPWRKRRSRPWLRSSYFIFHSDIFGFAATMSCPVNAYDKRSAKEHPTTPPRSKRPDTKPSPGRSTATDDEEDVTLLSLIKDRAQDSPQDSPSLSLSNKFISWGNEWIGFRIVDPIVSGTDI